MEPPTLNLEEPGSIQTLARLRERVEAAAREIERLRIENRSLSDRLAELETFSDVLPETGDPDVLKARLQRFIGAVDRALENAGSGSTEVR
jgi:regulator of replication initiation timing